MTCSFLGILHVPTSYTRPAGLQAVNGSDTFGGCPQTPQNCTVTEGGVDVCRCPGVTPATGVLIDGEIPTIDPVFDVNWSSQLFTVNRNGQSSTVIGFLFSSPFVLRGVEIKLFNCPAWSIVASTINVYGSLAFPTFILSTAIGSVDIAIIQDCRSLSTVVIPVQLTTSARDAYYIEMTFNRVPSAEWAPNIAEIQFSDETPTEPPTTEPPTSAITNPTSADNVITSSSTETIGDITIVPSATIGTKTTGITIGTTTTERTPISSHTYNPQSTLDNTIGTTTRVTLEESTEMDLVTIGTMQNKPPTTG